MIRILGPRPTEPDSIGAKILEDLDIDRSDLDEAIGTRSRRQGAQLHLDAPADQAVLASALELGHNYVGTEHILPLATEIRTA